MDAAADHAASAGISSATCNRTKRERPRNACRVIHSIDSVDLLRRIDDAAAAAVAQQPRVLVQVDLARETTKYGAPLDAICRRIFEQGAAMRRRRESSG